MPHPLAPATLRQALPNPLPVSHVRLLQRIIRLILTSQSRQIDPVLVREAARTKAVKEEATASFRKAHAATKRAERNHDIAVAAHRQGQDEEAACGTNC